MIEEYIMKLSCKIILRLNSESLARFLSVFSYKAYQHQEACLDVLVENREWALRLAQADGP